MYLGENDCIKCISLYEMGFLVICMVKNLPALQETQVQSLGWEDPLEKGMATYSTVLARRIPRTEDPGRLGLLGTPVHGVAKNWT